MSRVDRVALLLSLLAVLAGAWVHWRVFEGLPHIEDEMAYVWQAQAIAGGRLTVPSPVEPKSFLVPFIIDYNGQRFGKYPLGWPVMLAVGEFFGQRGLVNPLLAGLGLWLSYRLVKRLMGETVGLLAALLMLSSPFFLMNSGSLLSHPFGLVMSVGFTLAWLEAFCTPGSRYPRLAALTAGGALGVLALSRPLSAVCIGLPAGLHGLYLLLAGDRDQRRRVLALGLITGSLALLHPLWQYAVTGDPFLNPYTLWWPYDKVGFGPGYGHGAGHTLRQAWINTRFSLWVAEHDLFGWPRLSLAFMPFGLWAIVQRKNWNALFVAAALPSLVIVYMAYWIGSHLFGPRYYYEGLYAAAMLSAAGIAWLAGWPLAPDEPFPNYRGWRRWRALGMAAVTALLLAAGSLFYLPARLNMMYGLYGVQAKYLQPFSTPEFQAVTPALVIVHPQVDWIEYGRLLDLQTPFLDTPFVFVISHSASNEAVSAAFPDRKTYHYYPGKDLDTLFTQR
ncbi:MAG: glycosyltransferase family 39 protein [Chloroflexota bacterium]